MFYVFSSTGEQKQGGVGGRLALVGAGRWQGKYKRMNMVQIM
jgi:hypothetical protein